MSLPPLTDWTKIWGPPDVRSNVTPFKAREAETTDKIDAFSKTYYKTLEDNGLSHLKNSLLFKINYEDSRIEILNTDIADDEKKSIEDVLNHDKNLKSSVTTEVLHRDIWSGTIAPEYWGPLAHLKDRPNKSIKEIYNFVPSAMKTIWACDPFQEKKFDGEEVDWKTYVDMEFASMNRAMGQYPDNADRDISVDSKTNYENRESDFSAIANILPEKKQAITDEIREYLTAQHILPSDSDAMTITVDSDGKVSVTGVQDENTANKISLFLGSKKGLT